MCFTGFKCGIYLAHPRAEYFALGKIEKDQVDDYRMRKGISIEEAERWLSQNLNYDTSSQPYVRETVQASGV